MCGVWLETHISFELAIVRLPILSFEGPIGFEVNDQFMEYMRIGSIEDSISDRKWPLGRSLFVYSTSVRRISNLVLRVVQGRPWVKC